MLGVGDISFQTLNHASLTEGEKASTEPPEIEPEPGELLVLLSSISSPSTPPRGTTIPSLEARSPGPASALLLLGME